MATSIPQPPIVDESSATTAPIDYGEQPDALKDESSSPSGNEAGGVVSTEPEKVEEDDFHPGFKLWCIILAIAVTMLLAALENTVITVAAPEIVTSLNMGANYIWTTNAFLICSAAFQPIIGQFCNVFGRRYMMLGVVAIFTLGSGICGGAKNSGMLIAGRAIQGAGSGGIQLLNDVIISDLIPLRQRGNYIGAILAIYGVGTTLGPFIGGSIVSATTWRWVFYINLPIGGVSLVTLFIFLRVNWNRQTTFKQKIQRVDFVGNGVIIASTVAMLYALAYAGSRYSWGSWHTLVPLLIGFAGFGLFAWTQAGPLAAAEPVMPPRLFPNRTSIIICINTFINSAVVFCALFFLPVYFQACKLYGPQHTGVALLPQSLVAIPGAAIAAAAISRWGRYKPVHVAGFAIFTLGCGLLTLLDPGSSIARWAIFQCVTAIGAGMMLNSQLPAFQSPVDERDQAAATAAWGFIRSIGLVWGVAIPGTIFNSRIQQLLYKISDPVAREIMSAGGAYGAADAAQIRAFPFPVQEEIRDVYAQAIKLVFQVMIGFTGLAFLLSLWEHEIRLRENLETEFGLEHKNDRYKRAAKAAQSDKDIETGTPEEKKQ